MSINLHLGRAQPFYMSAWSKAEQLPNVRWQLNSQVFWTGGTLKQGFRGRCLFGGNWSGPVVFGAKVWGISEQVETIETAMKTMEKSITTLGKSMNTMEEPAKTMEKSMNSANDTF